MCLSRYGFGAPFESLNMFLFLTFLVSNFFFYHPCGFIGFPQFPEFPPLFGWLERISMELTSVPKANELQAPQSMTIMTAQALMLAEHRGEDLKFSFKDRSPQWWSYGMVGWTGVPICSDFA